MNRHSQLLQHINKQGIGLEIGPFENPVAPKYKGFKVEIVDHLPRKELLLKYQKQIKHEERIEEVDYVWTGQSYAELTGKREHYDWVIASHVIEPTPDLIAFINSCDEVLKADGVLSLAIPDKRYCFDHFRPITSLAQVIDSHEAERKCHSPGSAADYYLNVVSKNDRPAWQSRTGGAYKLTHSIEDARHNMDKTRQHYIDLHAWCFVPHAFRLLIKDLNDLGLIQLKEVGFYTTQGCEFYMALSRSGQGLNESRLALLHTIEQEQCGQLAGKHRGFVRRLVERFLQPAPNSYSPMPSSNRA